MTDFTVCYPNMEEGTCHAGFTVTQTLPLAEYNGMAYVMRHEPTGARALWVACSDTNKSFAIAFKTPPADDTGVFHILEHSVLCGSDRFPVKEPFVNLLKTSMQTFLNALTFSDKTMYPVASTNTRDLENLMDVYLDAVLHPLIYHNRHIFEQEGWHLEVQPDGSLVYNGVVFNEMKGATSDPNDMLYHGVDRALFPDSPYSFESGGDPRAIPTLTYEEFLNNHARHYNLRNSYIILYGDMDIERELSFIDERLETQEMRTVEPPNPLTLQSPVCVPYTSFEMATAPENAAVALAYVLGTSGDFERVLAADILLDAIAGSNESPLKRHVLDAEIADDFTATLVDGSLQPRVMFTLRGAKPNVADRFKEIVEGFCAKLVDEGIPKDLLQASLAHAEFVLREQDTGPYPTGIIVSINVMSSWLYDDERPVDYLRFEDSIAHMREGLDSGYFERLLREVVIESNHCAEVELIPTAEGAATDEAEELRRLREGMSDADVAAIEGDVAELRAHQEAPDALEDLAKLPQLRVSDITDPVSEPELEVVDAPLPCLYHDLETRHIDYIYHYFELSHIPFEEMPYVAILTDLLGTLPTKRHSAAELDTLVQLNLGSLSFAYLIRKRDNDLDYCQPVLVCFTSVLSENVAQAAQIPQEVWGETLFEDTDRMLDIITQRRIALERSFVNAGHTAAERRLTGCWAAASRLAECTSGVDFYLFLKDLLAHWDERKQGLCEHLEALSRRIFTASNVTVSFTGPAQDREAFWEAGSTLGLAPQDLSSTHLAIPAPVAANEAFVVPSNVCFVAAGTAPSPLDHASLGIWKVARRVLTFDYLWNEVRVKGGAYGTGFERGQTGIVHFYSYRDPGIDPTLERFGNASEWLSNWDPSEAEMDGYVVSCVASHDSPRKPRQIAATQDATYFSDRPKDWRDRERRAILESTADDIRELAQPLADFDENRRVCVFGSREIIEASGLAFDSVCDLMG